MRPPQNAGENWWMAPWQPSQPASMRPPQNAGENDTFAFMSVEQC